MSANSQALGPTGVAVYPSLTALGLETGSIQQGAIVAVENPFALYLAVQTVPSGATYATTSTSASTASPPSQVTYWLNLTSGGVSSALGVTDLMATQIAAYSGTGTNTLTASATGAFGTADGVAVTTGMTIFAPPGLTNLQAIDSGPWFVTAAGGTGVKYVLTRPSWLTTGALLGLGATIKIGSAGTYYGNTSWRATGAKTVVIGTTDPGFYVERFTFQVTTASGVNSMTAGQPATSFPLAASAKFPVGIFSATQSNFTIQLAVATTNTSVVGAGMGNASSTVLCTAGYVGTAAAEIFCLASGQTTDTSGVNTYNVTLINF